MAFTNLGFEDESATVTGEPDVWTLAFSYGAEEVAAYDRGETLPDQPDPFESFDGGWSNDNVVLSFGDPVDLTELEFAVYDTSLPGGDETIEDFEEAWSGNHFFAFVWGAEEPASFDTTTPEDVEDFEDEWLSNESFAFDWAGVAGTESGTFDAESVEDFEESWSNDSVVFDWTGVTEDAATYDDGTGGTPEDVEDFEEVLLPFVVVANAGADTLTKTAHGMSDGQIVRVENSGGTLPGGLSPNTDYYVVNSTANTVQLSATSGGGAIDITDAGTGTHTCVPDGEVFWTLAMATI